MQSSKPSDSPQRHDTDKSLKQERDKSDEEVRRQNGDTASVVDAAIDEARGDADAALRATRGEENPTQAQRDAHALQDETIRDERDTADAVLEEERRERTRSLAAFFALERELTDRHLSVERQRADVALDNRDEFLAMVAHDLRGFMGEIVFRAAKLIRDAGEDEAGRRAREVGLGIQRSTAAMKRLVSDLLDIVAIEAGRLQVDVTSGDVAGVLRDCVEPLRFAAQGKGIALVLEEAQPTVRAMFDHDRVLQVLGNLVGNAMKFTPSGGTIVLQLAVSGDEVVLSVSDTGSGIPEDKLEAIFERFTQLVPTDRRGLGLGLYISRCIVEAQGGRIWAARRAGAGSTFSFTLPKARAA